MVTGKPSLVKALSLRVREAGSPRPSARADHRHRLAVHAAGGGFHADAGRRLGQFGHAQALQDAGFGQAAVSFRGEVGDRRFVAGARLDGQAAVGPGIAGGLDLHHIGEVGRQRGRPGRLVRVAGGEHHEGRQALAGRIAGEEVSVAVAGQRVQAGRGALDQLQAFAVAEFGVVAGAGEQVDPRARGGAAVGAVADVQRGRRAGVEDLAGQDALIGLEASGWALDAHEVGVEGAAGDGLFEVGIADEELHRAGGWIGLLVEAVDAAQEGPDVAGEGAAVAARRADADVAGQVDRPHAVAADVLGGDVAHLDPVGVGDGVTAGGGQVGADADAREADLVAVDRLFGVEGGLQGRAVAEADPALLDEGIGGEPEGLAWEVAGEGERLGIVEDPGSGSSVPSTRELSALDRHRSSTRP
ncbi:hypothetical protein ACE0DR_06605 [Azotobacter sp. CWF10]